MLTPDKKLDVRMQTKTDTSENWSLIEDTFTPLSGEMIIYSDILRIKIGDGKTLLKDLQFIHNGQSTLSVEGECLMIRNS